MLRNPFDCIATNNIFNNACIRKLPAHDVHADRPYLNWDK